MNLTLSDWNVKIFSRTDCTDLICPKCLENETFLFQIFAEADCAFDGKIKIESDLACECYIVKKMKGDCYLDKKTDDYYVYADDNMYPDLLRKTDTLSLKTGENATLFFEVYGEKTPGEHIIKISVGEKTITVPLTVLPKKISDTDLIVTHWFHSDCICNYYGIKPFSEEYYTRLGQFLSAYVKMGNNMILVPVFTPPLDTEVGKERLTVQLVGVEKSGDTYSFDFCEFDRYIALCQRLGIKYFELSHLFTQWGGKACPKIMVTENGDTTNMFGWDVASDDEKYLDFLKQYFTALAEHLKKLEIFDVTYMHLTDEPGGDDLARYIALSDFVRKNNYGMKTLDALSHYEIVKQGDVTLPAVILNSGEFDKFADVEKMIYYSVGVDDDYITNRYFHMPIQREEVLGLQLYETGSKGFLHWGFNFYNARLSRRAIDPYESATADGGFPAGDSFLVYPGKDEVEYSVRYFGMLKATEEYRLLKTVEEKYGKEFVLKALHEYGVNGVHEYPRSARRHSEFISNLKESLH